MRCRFVNNIVANCISLKNVLKWTIDEMVDSFYMFGCLFYVQAKEERNLKSGSFCIIRNISTSTLYENLQHRTNYGKALNDWIQSICTEDCIVAERKIRLILFDHMVGPRKKLDFHQIRASIFTLFFIRFLFCFPHVFFNCKFYVCGKGSASNVYLLTMLAVRWNSIWTVKHTGTDYRFLWLWIESVLNIDDKAMKSVQRTHAEARI